MGREIMEDGRRHVQIIARSLEAAKNIARKNKNLKITSGNMVQGEKEENGMKTYSFRIKDV